MSNNETITPIPNFPPELINAINEKKLVVFIGAGISRLKPINCLSWHELGNNLLDLAFKETQINYKNHQSIKKQPNPRYLITCAHSLLRNQKKVDQFYKKLQEELTKFKNKNESNIYNEIFKLGNIFITTNADLYFYDLFHKDYRHYSKGFFECDDCNTHFQDYLSSQNKNKILYQIHGSIAELKNKTIDTDSEKDLGLIFNFNQYITRYGNEYFKKFLENIFNNDKYSTLFLGYSLSEFEFLTNTLQEQSSIKHFWLKEYFMDEKEIYDIDKDIYKRFGIDILPYSLDKIGFEQIHEIIPALLNKAEIENNQKILQEQDDFLKGLN